MHLILPGTATFLLGLLLTLLVRRGALRLGVVAVPKVDRWHRRQVAMLGGVAMAGAILAGALLAPVRDSGVWILLGGALTLGGVGLADDLAPLKPQTKLIAQILVAAAIASFGLALNLTGYPLLNVLVTIFWIVGVTNALNLLDNMDGLAAGIASIAVGFRLVFFLMDGNVDGAIFAAIVLGAILGFLVFNFNPASIFMGDTGSLFLGVLVSGLNLVGGLPYSRGLVSVLLVPVLLLLVPIFDTAFVTIARIVAGRPVSVGGRDHTSHRLVALGLSERTAVLLLYALALGSGGIAYYSYLYGFSYGVVLVSLFTLGLIVLGLFLGHMKVYAEDGAAPPENAKFLSLITDFQYKRQVATVLTDLILIVLAYYSAYLLRFEGGLRAEEARFVESVPVVILCQMSAFALWRTYTGIWRYTSLQDLLAIAQAAAAGTVAAVVMIVLFWRFEGYSRSVFVLNWLLLVTLVGASRLSFRTLAELLGRRGEGWRRVLVYGAGDGGALVLREFKNNLDLRGRVVGFLDDDRSKHGTKINGVPVVGGAEDLVRTLDTLAVSQVVISTRKVPIDIVERIRTACDAADITVVQAALRFE